MNRKDKNYKEWLRLKEIESKIPWTYGKTKEEGEIKKLLDDPRFWKFHWMSDGPTKDIIKIYHKQDRVHNKRALKKNILMMVDALECYDDYVEYRYSHRNSAKWMWW